MMSLVVGATGMLGAEVCRLLLERGHAVRAMVRETSSPNTVARLKGVGASLVVGDLKDRPSLDIACRDVAAVVSTASSTLSRQAGDSIATVDGQGQLDLIDAATKAGVKRFVLMSFPRIDLDFPLQSAKRAAEERVRTSGMQYAILQPTCFMEVWLSPALGFDLAGGKARIYGTGQNAISWISYEDVAKFAAVAVDAREAENTVTRLGGPEPLSPLEVVRVAEQTTGKSFVVDHVSEEALRAEFTAAADPLQKSFAALMLYCARGNVIEMDRTSRTFPVGPLKTVRQYLETGAGSAHAV